MTVSPRPIDDLCIIGIGNTLAGDDGAGIVALERLKIRYYDAQCHYPVCFAVLPGDLYSVTDFLAPSRRIIFLDAIAGTPPGELITLNNTKFPGLPASLHQLDICSVMRRCARLELCTPFPLWEIRGITIAQPGELKAELSPAIDRAVNCLVTILLKEIDSGTVFKDFSCVCRQ